MASRDLPKIRHALRRSRVRSALLLAIARLGRSYASDLAREAGIRDDKVELGMFGDDHTYRREDGLVPLGLVQLIHDADGEAYAITRSGQRTAAALRRETVAELTRRNEART